MHPIRLDFIETIHQRISGGLPLIQVLLGPRQVGKTTGVKQLIQDTSSEFASHYASADAVFKGDWTWIEHQWQQAVYKGPGTLLVLDEIQKIENWSEIIKKLWDQHLEKDTRLRVLLLGSSSLALQTGLTESLTGRFELIRAYHWGPQESEIAFKYDFSKYLSFGGYPGASSFDDDEDRWLSYVQSSIVETVIDKDILQLRTITRPALFRQVFALVCSYPAQELSLRKLVGQLQDSGAVETIQNYLEILAGAFLVTTLSKYSTNRLQKKSSSPKLMPMAPALCSFARGTTEISNEERGRIFELVVGLELLKRRGKTYYWRQGNDEVDFVYQEGKKLIAIEVKSGRKKSKKGLAKFKENFPEAQIALVDHENFFSFFKNL